MEAPAGIDSEADAADVTAPGAPGTSGAAPGTSGAAPTISEAAPTISAAAASTPGAELIARAQLITGEANVVLDPAVVETYRRYGLDQRAPVPLMVVLPGSAAEVAGVVGACHELSVGWTARGAATSPDGSGLPKEGAALIVLTRMRRILRPPDPAGEVTVEPGVPVAALRRLLGRPVLPGASPSATVGGHVASVRGLRGVTGIELVEPDGSFAQADVRHPGYDLAGAFCGSRGAAGIAVSLTLRLGGSSPL